MTTTYKRLCIEDVETILHHADLKYHVAQVSLGDPTLARVKLEPVLHNGKPILDEASSIRRKLTKAGAILCFFSIAERVAEFRIEDRTR